MGHISPLVTQEQFDRVQAKLAVERSLARRNNRVHTYLLRALVSCGHCRLTFRRRDQSTATSTTPAPGRPTRYCPAATLGARPA